MPEQTSPNDMAAVMAQLRMPEGCNIRRKETFEYLTPHYTYNIELFQNADNTWYAIAIPRDSDRLVVYGSSVLSSAHLALQSLLDKIQREGMHQLFGNPEPEDEFEEDEFEDSESEDYELEAESGETASPVATSTDVDDPDHPIDEY
ncbi:hypothetical protein [Alicyclobacillus mengziensis]|uniref:Uncharacterized protein n=1 Tax=Alicyclobacillus mengziensis TaxID=2931921 RepID=A0A9X7W2I7_9BACL|nr:hypothetical protein [Alicyclobacillus mengziensis]QSO49165.1 hypothetical protein JZ786_09705 [Alicyclobacillus mengziensis]